LGGFSIMNYYLQALLRHKQEVFPPEYLCDRLIQSKIFIDQNFAQPISLQEIVIEANISKYHFIRLFRDFYGTTPHQYLKEVRVSNAKQYLRKGMRVADACYSVGFDSVTSFTGLFKKMTGSTPYAFQQAAKRA
jgi:AraC-like DNA-binding protein